MTRNATGTQVIRIAGAGPAGLACAIDLAQRGFQCKVFERHPTVGARFDGDHQVLPGFGDDPRGPELLEDLGISSDSLEWRPLRQARFLDGDGRVANGESAEPFAYLVRRGPEPGTLDHAMAERARELGVGIVTDRVLAPDNADVIATGLRRVDGLAVERMFRTDAPDRADVLLDEELAPGGYAYLFVYRGEATLGIAALGAFKDLGERLQRAHDCFNAIESFDEVQPRSAAHGMNFSLPPSAMVDGRPHVGEAAGFQDFLFGLGLRMAIISGRLAARSLTDGQSYDELWQAELRPRMLTSLVDRWLYERGTMRRWLFARMQSDDLCELLDRLQRPHWGKQLLLPWVKRTRMLSDDEGGSRPMKKVGEA